MPDLLIELLSEEIPARMQEFAANELKKNMLSFLADQGVSEIAATAYSTPRRLTLFMSGLPEKAPDISEERKGPRICLLYTSPSPRDRTRSRMPSSA